MNKQDRSTDCNDEPSPNSIFRLGIGMELKIIIKLQFPIRLNFMMFLT